MTLEEARFRVQILPRLQVLRVLRRPTQPNYESAGMEREPLRLRDPEYARASPKEIALAGHAE